MLKMNEVLKASKGLYVDDSFAMLWGKQLGGWKVAELTGTLPMTFRSNGTALINYRIFGVAEGAGLQTENLFDGNYESAFINTATNTYQPLANGRTALIKCEPDTDYTITRWEGGNRFIVADFPQMPVSGDSANILASYTTNLPTNLTIHTNVDAAYFVAYISSVGGDPVVSIVKGSTAVPYEPYGYKLPLTVTSGAERKDADIFIGDSKLLSGDYIDYESGKIVRNGTPQDPPLPFPAIETFNGENTLDSTETLGEVTIKGRIKEAE